MKTGVVIQIPLEDLKDDPNNFFETEGGLEIEKKNAEMADSIETDGLISPVVVRPDPEDQGKYIIVSGHRRKMIYGRLAAQGKEKFAKVPCIIRNIKDELKAQLMLIESNSTGREISDWEKSQAVKVYGEIIEKMKQAGEEMTGNRRDHIAAALGISKTQVGQYEHINKKLAPEYKEEMKKGNIGVSVADKLAALPEAKQKEMHAANPAPKIADVPAPKKPAEEKPAKKEPEEPKETNEINAGNREWAIERIIGRLENIADSERDMAAATDGQSREQHAAAAEYADEFVEMAKRDLLDLSGIDLL